MAAQRARRDVIAAGQVFQDIELLLRFAQAPLQDFNPGFGSNTCIAFIEIYAARCFPETSGIFERLPVSTELSPSAFEFISQFRRLLGIPPRVLGFHVRFRQRCRR